MTTTTHASTVNGVSIRVLSETISAVDKDRELGLSRFKISNTWDGGTRSTSTVEEMYAAKQTIPHKAGHQMHSDEPEMLSGTDAAPNPVEQLLSALASCVVTSIIAHASMKGIEINSLRSELEGDINLTGFLGLDDSISRGYNNISIKLFVDSPHKDLEEIRLLSYYSPVFNTIANSAKLDVSIAN